MTIVTGKPGVGKSAEVKEVLQKDFPNASVFVFRADQFNKPTMANVFACQGVNETIHDIFSCISLIPEKLIFIDSLEKLLEADPECAFKQLLSLLREHPEIRVVTASRKYAIDLIVLKFGIDKDNVKVINIDTLVESELNIVAQKFPQLNGILKNAKVKKLLQSPKYLDFSISAISRTNDDYANVSVIEFKNQLWNSLVVDSSNTKNALPIKREVAFMEIALKRAREMKLFTKADKSDPEAIMCLEADEIIFQENQNRYYSPTHDILEDWALVKYISSIFDEHPRPKDLFSHLGNEPAIRRAFRLWVEDYLIEKSNKINGLIKAAISDKTIDKYWADELLVAIFKSESSNAFFSAFEVELLDNNATFFNRCLHILRTCCKESDQKVNSINLLLPIGSGWTEALRFIQKHIEKLDAIRFSVINFLADWYYRLIFQYNVIQKEELEAAKAIVLHYVTEIENGQEFWKEKNTYNKSEYLVDILLDLAEISKEEIKQLVAKSFANEIDTKFWRLNSFYKSVIDKCLSGVGHLRLIEELPELIVEIAWKNWKYVPSIETDFSDGGIFYARHSLKTEECWGIKDRHSFSPSGIFKTPSYNLLRIHPFIGLKFIIDFINYSVNFYVNADCEYKHQISWVKIELNDGTEVKQWAAWELWAAYRGLSVTSYALESLLMSLEKFLLEIANSKDISKSNLKQIFDYVLKNSNNVAPIAVLASVSIAYPEEVGEAMLPILTVREFFKWDLERALRERSTLSPMDNRISFAQEERSKSNQLPHRKKYQRGLIDFIIDYQFNIREINVQIHNIFDKLQTKYKDDDMFWKKQLNEIDIRKWEAQPYDEKLGGIVIQPKYEKEILDFLIPYQNNCEAQNVSLEYSGLISKAYEKKEIIGYEKWVECFNYYFEDNGLDLFYNRPVTLAIIGLNDFSDNISVEQKNWCLDTLLQSITNILEDTFTRNYELGKSYNCIEKEIALSSFHLLMQNINSEEDKNRIIVLVIDMLSAPFADYEIRDIIKYIREIFFRYNPGEAKRVWLGLIKYSSYRKSNPYFYDDHDSDRLREIKEILLDQNLELDFSDINFEKNEGYLLARSLTIMPCNTTDKDFEAFIKCFVPLLVADLQHDEDYRYNYYKNRRQIDFRSVLYIEDYLAEFLLNSNSDFAKSVLDLTVDPIYQLEWDCFTEWDDLFNFASRILENVIYKLDNIITKFCDEALNKRLITNFWTLWQHFFDKIRISGKSYFLSTLFLDVKWKETSSHWVPLENRREVYQSMVKDLGRYKPVSIINVFSTIGEKTFLPDSISWLVEIFKFDVANATSLLCPSAERMIKRLFYNHISKIKKDKSLIEDYMWILNQMVDLGSSEAYLFRENVITYKSYPSKKSHKYLSEN